MAHREHRCRWCERSRAQARRVRATDGCRRLSGAPRRAVQADRESARARRRGTVRVRGALIVLLCAGATCFAGCAVRTTRPYDAATAQAPAHGPVPTIFQYTADAQPPANHM